MQHLTSILVIGMVMLAGMAFCATADTSDRSGAHEVAKGFLTRSIILDGREIRYVVYVPPGYDPDKPMPTIIFLNGKGECGTDGLKQIYHFARAVILNVEEWPFIILFPQKQYALEEWEEHAWEDQEPMVMAALDKTKREYNVDTARIYLTGLSQGGHGTWAIAANHPDLFAAIAPICGWGGEAIAKRLTKMPIWVFHGEDDSTVPVTRAREMAEHLKSAGGSCELTIYPGVGHNSWDKAYGEENLGEWFLEHHK